MRFEKGYVRRKKNLASIWTRPDIPRKMKGPITRLPLRTVWSLAYRAARGGYGGHWFEQHPEHQWMYRLAVRSLYRLWQPNDLDIPWSLYIVEHLNAVRRKSQQ